MTETGASSMKKMNKLFFFWSYLVTSLIATFGPQGYPLLFGTVTGIWKNILVTIPSSFASIYSFSVLLAFIYVIWKEIPPERARTTPGKAIGFLCIPVFNCYWFFPALWGWAKDWNSHAEKSEPKLPQTSEILTLSIAIIISVSLIFSAVSIAYKDFRWVSYYVRLPGYVLVPVFIYRVCNLLDRVSAIENRTESVQDKSNGIKSLVLGVFSIILPLIGVFCGLAAISYARKQRQIYRESFSTAGLVTGAIGIALQTLCFIAGFFAYLFGPNSFIK